LRRADGLPFMNDSPFGGATNAPMLPDVPVVRLEPGDRPFDAVIERVARVIEGLVREGQPHLLVDATQAGFASPGLAERVNMVRRWAEAAVGRVRVVVVARPEFIDAERFGVVAARNFGLSAQVFAHEREALQWLTEERAAELNRSAAPKQE
jgi:hypothetical protein